KLSSVADIGISASFQLLEHVANWLVVWGCLGLAHLFSVPVSGTSAGCLGLREHKLSTAERLIDRLCTVLYKTERWIVPDFFPWGVPLPLLYEFISLRWTFSKFIESNIKRNFGWQRKHRFEKSTSFSFCKKEVFMVNGEDQLLKTDLYYLVPDGFTLHKERKETPILYLFSMKARYYEEVSTEKISFLLAKNTK
ncbi:hypothetical protein CFP56_023165, partial [Quercus suber]